MKSHIFSIIINVLTLLIAYLHGYLLCTSLNIILELIMTYEIGCWEEWESKNQVNFNILLALGFHQ